MNLAGGAPVVVSVLEPDRVSGLGFRAITPICLNPTLSPLAKMLTPNREPETPYDIGGNE